VKEYKYVIRVTSGGRRPQSITFHKEIATNEAWTVGTIFIIGDIMDRKNRVETRIVAVDDATNTVTLEPIKAAAHRDYSDVVERMRRWRWYEGG